MELTLNLENCRLSELSPDDLLQVTGGTTAPSKDTSWAYDIAYYVGAFFRCAAEMGKAARGNPHF